jgi:hypothetical protein
LWDINPSRPSYILENRTLLNHRSERLFITTAARTYNLELFMAFEDMVFENMAFENMAFRGTFRLKRGVDADSSQKNSVFWVVTPCGSPQRVSVSSYC